MIEELVCEYKINKSGEWEKKVKKGEIKNVDDLYYFMQGRVEGEDDRRMGENRNSSFYVRG